MPRRAIYLILVSRSVGQDTLRELMTHIGRLAQNQGQAVSIEELVSDAALAAQRARRNPTTPGRTP